MKNTKSLWLMVLLCLNLFMACQESQPTQPQPISLHELGTKVKLMPEYQAYLKHIHHQRANVYLNLELLDPEDFSWLQEIHQMYPSYTNLLASHKDLEKYERLTSLQLANTDKIGTQFLERFIRELGRNTDLKPFDLAEIIFTFDPEYLQDASAWDCKKSCEQNISHQQRGIYLNCMKESEDEVYCLEVAEKAYQYYLIQCLANCKG